MSFKHQRVRGTRDFVPPDGLRKARLEAKFRRYAELYGFQEVVTPLLEHTGLFTKSSGTTSDVVTKEMYTFTDRSGRSITLRPEGTPGVVRALLEEGLRLPCRVYYIGPMFRYCSPQKGRYREFYQLGVEVFGEASPQVDAEVITLGSQFLTSLGITDCVTRLNTIGCRDCRPGYQQVLSQFLAQLRPKLCPDCQVRAEQNPLRVQDCKNDSCRALIATAPLIREHLCPACAEHFAGVKAALALRGQQFVLDDQLVRGLDYYTRTAFEYVSASLGAQDSLGGGGRYDYLVQDFGGPPTPAIGFALGEERILLASQASGEVHSGLVFVIPLSERELPAAVALLAELRAAGIPCQIDFDHPKIGRQLKTAADIGARMCAILGEQELAKSSVTVKDLTTGKQQSVEKKELISYLRQRLDLGPTHLPEEPKDKE